MAILINEKNCQTVVKNLGLPDCIIQEGRLTGFYIVPKGWALDLTTGTFDKAYIDEQIQLGELVPILGAVEGINNTPEATIEGFQGGIKTVVRNGLPEYQFKFVKGGWKFASALYTYNSFQAFDVLFVFSSGAIAGATSGNNLTGFDLGMMNTGTYMFTDGTASSYVTVALQLINEVQFNRDVALLDASVLDFNANTDIYPITDITITGRADVSESKVYFKAKYAINNAYSLLGLASTNIKSYKDGVDDPFTGLLYNGTTDEYEFTPTAAFTTAEKFVVTLYDTVNTIDVAKVGSRFYKGVSPEIVPVT